MLFVLIVVLDEAGKLVGLWAESAVWPLLGLLFVIGEDVIEATSLGADIIAILMAALEAFELGLYYLLEREMDANARELGCVRTSAG